MENLYEILEVSKNASKEVIDKAYKVLAKKYHPDLQGGSNKTYAEDMMKKLNNAYEVLSNDEKRLEYDKKLEAEIEIVQNQKASEKTDTKQYTDDYNNYQENNNRNSKNDVYNEEDAEDWKTQYYNLSEKEQKKLKKKIEKNAKEEYRNLYEDYFRKLGYKVPHKITWKEVKAILIVIAVLSVILLILWLIPPTREYMIDIYNSNIIVKVLVNFVGAVFKAFKNTIQQIFS